MSKMDLNIPLDDFSRILFLIAEENGDMGIDSAMESGLLQEYVDRYKAGELILPEIPESDENETWED